jgi:aldehyde oxidoreductase
MGVCDYGDDIGLKMPPGTLHLAVVMPELSHALIKNIDYSEAEKLPGVEKVITAKDVKGNNRTSFPLGHPRGLISGLDHQLFAEEKVYMRGDILAVVAARTQEEARTAAKAVKAKLFHEDT